LEARGAKKSQKVFSLSELTLSLENQINKIYDGSYWITAEILKLNHYPQSGHCYPQLVEKRNGAIVADMKGFISREIYQSIKSLFLNEVGKPLSDGMQVLFRCKLRFHSIYGLSINILDIEPSFTLGEMARLRKEAIKRLKSEGLFENNRRLQPPILFKSIAVISVETSKGLLDFRQVLSNSKYAQAISLSLFPALLQGDAAVQSISRALEKVSSKIHCFDAVALVRGGGGETGLDCYDSYQLAKAVANFPIPVLSGIGHASNSTVTEQVSYKSLLTPTDLARFILQTFEDFEDRINGASLNISRIVSQSMNLAHHTLFELSNRLEFHSSKKTDQESERLTRRVEVLARASKKYIAESIQEVIITKTQQIITLPGTFLNSENQNLSLLNSEVLKTTKHKLQRTQAKMELLEEKVKLLDPESALKRGFSLTSHKGKIIHSITELEEGDLIETLLVDGKIQSTVTNKNHDQKS
jgi:exodeoxyribonuclease VII large subunit